MNQPSDPAHASRTGRLGRLFVAGSLALFASVLAIGPSPSAAAPVCTITGTSAGETLRGTTGADVLCGLGGNDVLIGLGGADELRGGDGDDLLRPGAGNDPTVGGGNGADTVSYLDIPTSGVTVDLAAGTATGPTAGNDVVSAVERAEGTAQDDIINGSAAADWLTGRGGNDTLSGGDGNDVLTPGTGNDGVNGGLGIDVVRYNDITAGGVTVDLGAGTVTGPTSGSDALTGIERAFGTPQADTLAGSPGDDMLWGSDGIDTIDGLAGDDTILPGAGNDPSVQGGLGTDTVNYSDVTGAGGTIDIGLATTSGTTIGNDVIAGFEAAVGTRQDDTLIGGVGNDRLVGLEGDDHLSGAGGDNTLLGGDGEDLLEAGSGNDLLDGGAPAIAPGDLCDVGSGAGDVEINCEGSPGIL